MQQLSNILPAAMSKMATPKEPRRGLTTKVGITNQSPARLQNSQIMNVLCLLASEIVAEKQEGKYGNTDHGWDFIPTVTVSKVALRPLTPEEFQNVLPLLACPSLDIVRGYLVRLALIKKIGSATEATMPYLLQDMAAELIEFSELAILLAFKEIKREEGPWMPELGRIIKSVQSWQKFADHLYEKSTEPPKQISKKIEKVEEEWKPPTDAEKEIAGRLVQEALRNLGAR